MSRLVLRSKPKWSIPDFFKYAEMDGYVGMAPYRWWRGNHQWAAGFLWKRVFDEPGSGPRTKKWCQYPWMPTPRRRPY